MFGNTGVSPYSMIGKQVEWAPSLLVRDSMRLVQNQFILKPFITLRSCGNDLVKRGNASPVWLRYYALRYIRYIRARQPTSRYFEVLPSVRFNPTARPLIPHHWTLVTPDDNIEWALEPLTHAEGGFDHDGAEQWLGKHWMVSVTSSPLQCLACSKSQTEKNVKHSRICWFNKKDLTRFCYLLPRP